jgi:hypothetical protein
MFEDDKTQHKIEKMKIYIKNAKKTAYVILAYSHKSAIVNIIWYTVISVILNTGTFWADSLKWLD